MSHEDQQNVALVSYVSPELLSRVQQAAKRSNRSVAGQVREVLERTYSSQPKTELR
jgi:hypothetical protein